MSVTRWFRDTNGRISQINNVTKITFASPLIANGYFRDSPPVVIGGAAMIEATSSLSVAVAGGTTQTVNGSTGDIIAPSSVVQDDAFTHTDLRFVFYPIPLVFFETDDALATNPTDSSFSKTRPVTNFDTFDVDCVFSWGEDCAIFNAAPQGWDIT